MNWWRKTRKKNKIIGVNYVLNIHLTVYSKMALLNCDWSKLLLWIFQTTVQPLCPNSGDFTEKDIQRSGANTLILHLFLGLASLWENIKNLQLQTSIPGVRIQLIMIDDVKPSYTVPFWKLWNFMNHRRSCILNSVKKVHRLLCIR